VLEIVEGEDGVGGIALERCPDGFGADGENQVAVGDGFFTGTQGALRRVDGADLGPGEDAGPELFGHGRGIGGGQFLGVLVLGESGRQQRLGIAVAAVGADDDQRGVGVQLAEFPGQGVAGQACSHNHYSGGHWEKLRSIGEMRPGRPREGSGDLDHLEVALADAAVRAQPVLGHVFPAGAGGDAVVRPAFGLVIDQPAYDALPLLHVLLQFGCRPAAAGLSVIQAGWPMSFSSMASSVLMPEVSRMRSRISRFSSMNSGDSFIAWLRSAGSGTWYWLSMRPGRGAISTMRVPR